MYRNQKSKVCVFAPEFSKNGTQPIFVARQLENSQRKAVVI